MTCPSTIFFTPTSPSSLTQTFATLKRAGKIPPQVKFQIDLVPAHSVIWLFVQEDLQRAIDSIYNDAVLREIDKIAAAIPHDQMAIQFDIASAVFARLERDQPSPYGNTKEEMQATFSAIVVRLAEHVPADIDLMFHFCYGDAGHRHVVEPTDMGDMVDYANRLAGQLTRPITQVHMPVPRDRSDATYFAPLRRLKLDPGTRLCLGLVHYTDGLEGTRKAPRNRAPIRERFRYRHGMRLRPPRSRDNPGSAAHPCRGGEACMIVRATLTVMRRRTVLHHRTRTCGVQAKSRPAPA